MVSKQEAFAILGLKNGASSGEIEKKYKELSLEWYPQKHNYSALSNQKFKDINKAYLTLTTNKENVDDMSMSEMLVLFEKVFFGDDNADIGREIMTSDEDYDSDEDVDYSDTEVYPGLLSDCFPGNPDNFVKYVKDIQLKKETAQKNAESLIAEEEKEKRKAAKRKEKKKRRKLKKKREKDAAHNSKKDVEAKASQVRSNESNTSATEVEEEGLDPSSAFVATAVSKSKVSVTIQQKKDAKPVGTNGNAGSVLDVNPQVLHSRELAIRGNMMANIGEYHSAIGLFTDSIKLDPTEFKYFCNRSYCYHQLGMFEKALKDAEKAIVLQPTWPKGYFRKGQAQTGLLMYAEAEASFRKVIVLDKSCKEAIQEVKRTQTCQLMEMGFSQKQAEQALDDHVNLQEATEALLSGAYPSVISQCATNGHNQERVEVEEDDSDEIYMSDEDERLQAAPHPPWYPNVAAVCQTTRTSSSGGVSRNPGVASSSSSGSAPKLRTISLLPAPTRGEIAASAKAGLSDFKMDTRNPEGRLSLWVGNVKAQVTEKMLSSLFAKFGVLTSIRMLPDRRCAFVNYKDKNSAGKAMLALQGHECCGENLLIRFPDKVHTFGEAFVMKKKGYPQQNRK